MIGKTQPISTAIEAYECPLSFVVVPGAIQPIFDDVLVVKDHEQLRNPKKGEKKLPLLAVPNNQRHAELLTILHQNSWLQRATNSLEAMELIQ